MHQNSKYYALQLMKAFHQGDNTSTQIFVTKFKKIFPFPDFVQWWQMESPENITGVWWSKWTSVLQRMDRQSSRAKQESTALWYTAITKILLKYITRIQYKWFIYAYAFNWYQHTIYQGLQTSNLSAEMCILHE